MEFKKFTKLSYDAEMTNFNVGDFQSFCLWCIKNEVSDITLQNDERIVCEIHGKKHLVTKKRLTKTEVSMLLKTMHSMGAESSINSGEDLDFTFQLKIDKNEEYRFRGNAKSHLTKTEKGLSITLRYINQFTTKLENLNLPKEMLEGFYSKRGVVIVSGPTGSGKSTLLSSVIEHRLAEPDAHIKVSTFENPIEFTYDHVEKITSSISQCEIDVNIGSFAKGIRNSLRTRADIVLIGEARDYETIAAVIEGAMVGPLVYTTCHTKNVAEVPARLINVFPENEKEAAFMNLIDNLEMIVTQKLVPSTDGKRVAIREFLVFNQEMKDLLIEGGLNNITYTLRKLVKEHGRTFLEDLTDNFMNGRISEEDFLKERKELK